jgi:histidinol-phosphatase (PHP family)
MFWDTHVHSQYSGDSHAPQDVMIAQAKKKDLAGLCFTDHLDLDYPNDPVLFLLDLPNYAASVDALREKNEGIFPVRFGIELGLQPHLADIHAEILSQYPFDFVIGSSHLIHGFDPYYKEFFEGRDEEECYLEYFCSVLENIKAFDGFDVYGHLDYVVRYGPSGGAAYSYRRFADIIDEILRLLIEKGKGIELNTAGFKYGLGRPNPCEDVLRRYRELGGEIITVGSDAHAPEYLSYAFDKVPQILADAGFRYFTVFEERKPHFLPIGK